MTPIAKSITLQPWVSTFSFDEKTSLKDYYCTMISMSLLGNQKISIILSLKISSDIWGKGWWAERLCRWNLIPGHGMFIINSKILCLWCICPRHPTLTQTASFPCPKDTNNLLLRIRKRILFIWAFYCYSILVSTFEWPRPVNPEELEQTAHWAAKSRQRAPKRNKEQTIIP